MSNEADRRRQFEIDVERRLDDLTQMVKDSVVEKNANAMKSTIEHWNNQFAALETRMNAIDNNILNFLQIVKDIQHNNTLALAKQRGTGPTAP